MASPGYAQRADLGDLMARVALGDQAAFKQMYQQTCDRLFSLALQVVKRQSTAEEVLQDAFVTVWNQAKSYSAAKGQPMTWLMTIVRNRAIDLVRAQKDEVSLTRIDRDSGEEIELEIPDDDADPAKVLESIASDARVRDCLSGLDAKQRQGIALAFYHGLSHSELAEHMKEPLGTVKAWIRRGLDRLRNCLEL